MGLNKFLHLPLDAAHDIVTLLETGEELLVERSDNDLQITIPEGSPRIQSWKLK